MAQIHIALIFIVSR